MINRHTISHPTRRTRVVLACCAGLIAISVVAGCGSGSSPSSTQAANPNQPENSPAGDIPDNQAFVRYSPPGAGFSVKVPEGWSRSNPGAAVVFSDKLNSIRLESAPASRPLTVSAAKQTEVPKLQRTVKGFKLGRVSTAQRNAGTAVRITYLADAKVNPVTGKAGTDAVERYYFSHQGQDAIITLSGLKGADNVDPWRIVTDSVNWSA